MKRKLPREEKEEKKNKKAKRMKTKEEQRAEKSKKEENQREQENKQQEETQKENQEEQENKQQEETQKENQEEQENKQQEEHKKETKKQQEEQEEKKTETKDLIIKETPLNEMQLEKIEKEIKTQSVITEEKKNKIHKKIFQNIIIAIGIVLYFIFINLGFTNIKPETFYKDLQVFSMISIIFTIVLMEKAYKKDNNELTIHTIEALVFSICTLLTIYIRNYYSDKFMWIINTISILFAIYYVGKCIIIDYKMTKKAKKRAREKRKLLNE